MVSSENQTSNYTIDPQQASAMVEVRDDGDTDRPTQVTLALSNAVTVINEGDTIPIRISADIDPIMDLQVSYSITNVNGNFYTISNGTQRETNFVTLAFTESSDSEEYVASFSIETRVENGLDEENGTIIVSLNSTADYNISPFEEDSATITINDVDVPELSIEESVSVTAPDAVIIEIYSDIEPWQPLTVEYTPDLQTGNFLDTTAGISGESRTVELEFTESTTLDNWVAQLSILTVEDENLENGTFIVTLEPAKSSDQGTYSVSPSTSVSTVYASNLPISNLYFMEESITISEEDGIATLKIATTFGQKQVLNVNFIPTDTSGDFLDETDGLSGEKREIELNFELAANSGSDEDDDSNPASIENYKLNLEDDTLGINDELIPLFIAELEIPIRDVDGIYDENGTIAVELVESSGYSVDQSRISKAQILIEDVDIPELSLSSEVEAVAGGVIYLPVTSDVTIRKKLEIKYIATNKVGDFLDETAGDSGSERKVSLAFTQSEIFFNAFASFPLNISYSEDFNTGRIEVKLVEDREVSKITYTIDRFASTTTIEVTRGAIPEIAILDPNITVDEDSSVAEILIEASIDPERALWVSYTPENTIGDFIAEIDENSETSRVEILRFTLDTILSQYTSVLRINLRSANGIDENNGSILITLDKPTRESGYTIDGTRNESIITVNDIDDVPSLSISDVRDIETLEQFVFELTLSQISRKEITVDFETSSITAFKDIDFENSVGTITIPAEQITSTIVVRIIQDRETEFEEYFSLSLSNPVNVQLDKSTAVGVIAENEKWLVSIATVYDQIIEGENAQIVISSNLPISGEPLPVSIGVNQVGDVVKWRVKRFVRMTGTEYTYILETKDNVLVDSNKRIIVKLVPGRDYDIKPDANQVVIDILDNDNTNETLGSRISPSPLIANALLHNIFRAPRRTENQGPFITINAIKSIVNEGEPATFEIQTRSTLRERIVVNLDVQGSVGLFDRNQNTSVTLDSNNTSVIFTVNTMYDNNAEDDEMLEVSIIGDENYRIGNPGNAAVKVVDIDDRKNAQQQLISGQQSILPEILGFVSEQTLSEISNRGNQVSSGQINSAFNFGGNTAITDMIKEGGELINKDSTSWQELLDETRFQFSLVPGSNIQTPATLWGIGDYQQMNSYFSETESTWEGDLFSGLMGIDTTISDGLIAGLAVSTTLSSIDYQLTNEHEVKIASSSFGLNPFISWQSQDNDLKLNAFGGFGLGGLELELPDFGNQRVNNQSYSFGISGSNQLHATDSILNGISNELDIVGETWFAGQSINALDQIIDSTQISSGRFRVYGKNSTQIESEFGSTFNPTLNIGVRGDSKNAESIFGLELEGEVKYSNIIGFSLNGNSNFYITQLDQVQRWDLEGAFKFDQGNDELGVLLEVNPYWQISNNADQTKFWNSELLTSGIDNDHASKATQLATELGFGFNFADGLGILTPFSGFETSELNSGKRYLGARVSIGSNLRFEIEGSNVDDSSGEDKQNLELNGSFNW